MYLNSVDRFIFPCRYFSVILSDYLNKYIIRNWCYMKEKYPSTSFSFRAETSFWVRGLSPYHFPSIV